ncbi:hypothetical protein AB2M62_16905 [Sphingomonas sp. MMS12-HWE2-04]|uniref:hypothetical protein n=1 Tax=Sphingomonas sp. MMS12-HWE2-04 TaxID=3234199 RepID=UPI00384B481A
MTTISRRRAIQGFLASAVGACCAGGSAAKQARVLRPEAFGAAGDGVADDGPAFRRACREAFLTGGTLVLSPRRYRGARLEVHGSFDVEGNGATIDYLGVGNTPILGRGRAKAAVATAWPATDKDALAHLYPVSQRRLLRPAAAGATSLNLNDPAGLLPGDWLFLAQHPTSMSSPDNFIPRDFEFVAVASVNQTGVALRQPMRTDMSNAAAVFHCRGIAHDCTISNLVIATDVDAYQHVIRSAINVTLENIVFAGHCAVGASTFSDGLAYRQCRATNAYGCLSIARGSRNVLVDGFEYASKTTGMAEPFAVFVEESFYDIVIRRVQATGGGFSIRAVDLDSLSTPRRLTLERSSFRSDNANAGPTGALHGAVAIGTDISVSQTYFRGHAIRPDSQFYPGVVEPAVTWMATMQTTDRLRFDNCVFQSDNGGRAFAGGSGFLARLSLDPRTNRFLGCEGPRVG